MSVFIWNIFLMKFKLFIHIYIAPNVWTWRTPQLHRWDSFEPFLQQMNSFRQKLMIKLVFSGSRFALMELKAILYYMLLHFSFEPNENTQIPIKFKKAIFSIHPEKGLHLELKPRKTSSSWSLAGFQWSLFSILSLIIRL